MDPQDHRGVVDLQPGPVDGEVGVGHVQRADAEDERHPARRDGSDDVTATSNSRVHGAHARFRARV